MIANLCSMVVLFCIIITKHMLFVKSCVLCHPNSTYVYVNFHYLNTCSFYQLMCTTSSKAVFPVFRSCVLLSSKHVFYVISVCILIQALIQAADGWLNLEWHEHMGEPLLHAQLREAGLSLSVWMTKSINAFFCCLHSDIHHNNSQTVTDTFIFRILANFFILSGDIL